MYYSDEDEIQAIAKVLKSKKLFRYQGKDVETECSLFEKNFSYYLNQKYSILLSSGTNALVTALHCFDIGPGDEVIIPAYTFFATIAAVIEVGATPIIVNVDSFLTIDLEEIKNVITSKSKAIIAVHMDGFPCDMIKLSCLAKECHLVLIEDVAQAIGGRFNDQCLGTFGQAGCFSFNVDKIITCGEGGAICLPDQLLYQKAMMYHDTCNQFGPTCKEMYTIESFSGKSMRASEIQGAMINVQLKRLDKILHDLRKRKFVLENKLSALQLKMIPTYDSKGECCTLLRVVVEDPIRLRKLIVGFNTIGIMATSPIMKPAHHIWQWRHLLPHNTNHFKANFLTTINMLSTTLLIYVSLNESDELWAEKINKIDQLF
jgi:8-amino-3,8-dideoxy-alpha-D-manno-octulosonate transaminase